LTLCPLFLATSFDKKLPSSGENIAIKHFQTA
jgi:hypothetical protein